jgi:anti-sigma regulatory factor (Ser/Thr protein kinase)
MGVLERYPAVAESVSQARRAVEGFAQRCGADPETLGVIRLAVSEACTNAVLHAYADRDEAGDFVVSAEVVPAGRGDHLRVVVADDGRGMVPRLDSPGLGLGLPIIAQLAAAFEVRRAPAGGGTEICMRFPLAADEARPAA